MKSNHLIIVLFALISTVLSGSASFANDELSAIMKGIGKSTKELSVALEASNIEGALAATSTIDELIAGAYGIEPDEVAKLEAPTRAKQLVAYKKTMLKLQDLFLDESLHLINGELDLAKVKFKEIIELKKQGHGTFNP